MNNTADEFDDLPGLLREAGAHFRDAGGHPLRVPPEFSKAVDETRAQLFHAVRQVSEDEMRYLVLKTVHGKPMDGFELCTRLSEARVNLLGRPEVAIYRLLDDLEMSGHLGAEWVVRGTRRLKLYKVTPDVGWASLQGETVGAHVEEIAAGILGRIEG